VDTNGYVAFLVLGVVLVAIDGAVVYRSGRAYLNEAYRDPRASRSMVQLVTVLFHLVVLGLLALISTIDIDTGSQVQNVVLKLGVVLLVLGAAHAATMTILSHIRDRLRDDQITDDLVEQRQEQRQNGSNNRQVQPASVDEEYQTRHPAVSPPIEQYPAVNPAVNPANEDPGF
jgi:hypothetical protein